jgi:hypothetical protein
MMVCCCRVRHSKGSPCMLLTCRTLQQACFVPCFCVATCLLDTRGWRRQRPGAIGQDGLLMSCDVARAPQTCDCRVCGSAAAGSCSSNAPSSELPRRRVRAGLLPGHCAAGADADGPRPRWASCIVRCGQALQLRICWIWFALAANLQQCFWMEAATGYWQRRGCVGSV